MAGGWEYRETSIKDDNGNTIFTQKVEVPKCWSQLAANVVASKYLYGEIGTPERESSVKQLAHRVCRTIADWGLEDGYFADEKVANRFYLELMYLVTHQYGSFNSPVWFNVGIEDKPQASACFIQGVGDDMESIMALAASEAMLFKHGSGTGTDLSTIRSSCEKLNGGGTPSGPLSFMRVYDQIAGVIKSGGKTRRAAKMQSLKVGHPDIMEFIECKVKEEAKARVLIQNGYDADFNGDVYTSILYQNANLSVRLTDQFMDTVTERRNWTTRWVTDPTQIGPSYPAKDILRKMAECAWQCGDPGVQYDTTINEWHTCKNSGRINASNPCSEYMFLDDSACNLASVNLMKFRRPDGSFNHEELVSACRLFFIAQEILVSRSSYPTKRIAENSERFRPLGLGYSNLGSLIMASGLAYDSDEARDLCASVTALVGGAAYLTSTQLAECKGPFAAYEENEGTMLEVIEKHRKASLHLKGELGEAAKDIWRDVCFEGVEHGFRNAQATVLAPTGTISFMMDCDTTGIEPDIALVKYKQLAGGGNLKIVNQTVGLALESLGYGEGAIADVQEYLNEHGTIEGCDVVVEKHLPVFDCAFAPAGGERSIHWEAHIKMMAAAQPFISGAISKTVNMPNDATVEDIEAAYEMGWELGLKALAVYRDGSKGSQPVTTSKEEKPAEAPVAVGVKRRRLPRTRNSITHKFNVEGHEGYMTAGMHENGDLGEVFITMAKEGSTIGGLVDCFGTAISMSLQYGVPLEVLVEKFAHVRFEPSGYTKNPQIRIAKSVVDYIFRWLQIQFLDKNEEHDSVEVEDQQYAAFQSDAPACSNCGSITVRNGNCYLCYNCGTSLGCS
jgi:ribonucleoside-diphosphate reductase alpha chain